MSAALTWILHATALTAVVTLGLRFLRGPNATTRYCLWWVALAAVLALPEAHAVWPARADLAHAPLVASVSQGKLNAGEADGPRVTLDGLPPAVVVPDALAAALPWMAAAGVGLALWRVLVLLQAAAGLRRVRARCRPLPAGVESQLTEWAAARGRGRRAQLLMSLDLATPAVLGPPLFGRADPVIALPAWTIEALDPESLDLIVLHEYAHVERRDDRDLLVQSAIEAIFCWHIAVLWIGRRLDEERERACDDEVVRRTGRPLQYARCLVGVAARGLDAPDLQAAPGAGRPGGRLAARVERLLSGSPPAVGMLRISWVGAAAVALTVTVLVSAAAGPRVQVAGSGWEVAPALAMMPLPARALPAADGLATPVPAADALARSDAATVPAPAPSTTPVSLEAAVPADRDRRLRATPLSPPAGRAAVAVAERPPPVAAGTRSALVADPIPSAAWTQASLSAPVSAGAGAAALEHRVAPSVPGAALLGSPAARHFASISRSFTTTAGIQPHADSAPEQASPWKRTADAGESIGRGAAHAGVKTAGFFSRMGRALASSF